MHFYKIVDNEGYIRIVEECEAAVTFFVNRKEATILSLFVPRSDRREGVGSALLKAAEYEAWNRGVQKIGADYSDEIRGMTEFFEKAGYTLEEKAPVCSIDTAQLLSAEKVKKMLKTEIPGARFASLEELMMKQWDELLAVLSKFHIRLGTGDMSRFSQNMSGVVFDKTGTEQAVILCSEKEGGIHVDFLVSAQNDGRTYVLAALQGMLMEIYSAGGAKRYPLITALCVNESITKLMDSVLPDKPEQIARAMYAAKEMEAEPEAVEIGEAMDEDEEDEWHREVAKVPMQQNISWKVAWFRERQRGKDEEEEDAGTAADDTDVKEKKKAEEKVSPAIAEDTDREFPLELPDPLDIDYGFDKDEDEREGLLSDDTIRITADNLEEYDGVLPKDALQDIPRPWHRALVAQNGKKTSYLVYELKDMEDEKEGRSEICWLKLEDDGKELFSEYGNELKDLGVVSSFLETDPKQKKALTAAGFSTEERESEGIFITVGELAKLPLASKKTPDFVVGLKELGERQFKRGIGNCMINNRKGLLEDMAFLPMEWFEQDVSSAVLTDGRVSGLLLVHQLPSKRLMVDLLFSSSGDSRLDIPRMMSRSIQAAVEKYPKDTPVILKRHNKTVHALTDKLFPDKKGESVLYGERKEA
ncbi:MAG: GNAT family N-acetyltransferase [Lachnospiraceae bacterium]|nr:GNAT family N-acetyltransferase [Lachnospiraceae bacterium]